MYIIKISTNIVEQLEPFDIVSEQSLYTLAPAGEKILRFHWPGMDLDSGYNLSCESCCATHDVVQICLRFGVQCAMCMFTWSPTALRILFVNILLCNYCIIVKI